MVGSRRSAGGRPHAARRAGGERGASAGAGRAAAAAARRARAGREGGQQEANHEEHEEQSADNADGRRSAGICDIGGQEKKKKANPPAGELGELCPVRGFAFRLGVSQPAARERLDQLVLRGLVAKGKGGVYGPVS